MNRIFLLLLALTLSVVSYAQYPPSSQSLVKAALARTHQQVTYDGRYLSIPYPNGDVPANIGVCTDVVIRSYRQLGIDLQQKVHEDMKANFKHYPSKRIWGLTRPDSNIDHRRVPNLRTFFSRHGQSLAVSQQAASYQPGDLVTWMLPGNLPHIGIVTNQRSSDGLRPLIVHNIGAGPKLDDMLFDYKITGHYRYLPASQTHP
ncbi:DUF1287 domain-containing protein [Pleionea sp. CnH1-48]|uniref:DUF1287 domain-containing protein n=1 Tax=Pleionea sp. CnH1-48 TaxID=2954494 RepID=UPI002096ABDB|nr:DUF1287 domain-containing protein [Pleionea sp. CnH1-48]MCO7225155.1 DUF1287 domain-containing protein [Pleionea sp. CnH1-48]